MVSQVSGATFQQSIYCTITRVLSTTEVFENELKQGLNM